MGSGGNETRSLFAPVVSALLKLKSDAELFRAYSNHLSDKMESLWSEKLQLVHAGGGGVESVFVVSKEAEALHFYISRHLEILLLYLNGYIAGDRDYVTAENIANYWPYFLGQPDRLLVTAREDFLHGHLGDRERKTLTLRGRVEFIEEALAEAREEIGHKIKKELPRIEWIPYGGVDPAASLNADSDVSTRIIIADGLTNEFLSPEVQFRNRKVNIGAHEISRLMGSGPEFGSGPLPTFLSQIRVNKMGSTAKERCSF